MSENQYSRFRKDDKELILRDYLAIDRTLLSNESALLSYVRTSLAMLVAGISLTQFFDSPSIILLGVTLIAIAMIIVYVGVHRYNANRVVLAEIIGEAENATPLGRRYRILQKLYALGHGIFKKI